MGPDPVRSDMEVQIARQPDDARPARNLPKGYGGMDVRQAVSIFPTWSCEWHYGALFVSAQKAYQRECRC